MAFILKNIRVFKLRGRIQLRGPVTTVHGEL